jgi:integrase
MPLRLDNARALPTCPQQQTKKTFKSRFKVDHAASRMPETRQPERLAPRATSNRNRGRDHLGILGEIKSVHPGEIVGISTMWLRWSEKHRNQWPSSLKTYAYPTIGDLPIAGIRPSHIQKLLTPIWISKRETANRVRGRIETIIAAHVEVDDPAPNPAALTKVLREALPKRPKRVVQHHPALPYAEMPEFMVALSAASGRAAAMLRFLILTSCRTNEIVAGAWAEVDRPESIWKIPGERMKMEQDHSVPLSAPALALLDDVRNGGQSRLIFPGDDGEPFSENAMLAVLDRLGYGHVTVHGFRSTFATWAEDFTDYPDGVREAALAHKYQTETTAAYQRGQKLEKRRNLMNDWAAFVLSSNVAQIQAVA